MQFSREEALRFRAPIGDTLNLINPKRHDDLNLYIVP